MEYYRAEVTATHTEEFGVEIDASEWDDPREAARDRAIFMVKDGLKGRTIPAEWFDVEATLEGDEDVHGEVTLERKAFSDLDAILTEANRAMRALERDDTDEARQLLRSIRSVAAAWETPDSEHEVVED